MLSTKSSILKERNERRKDRREVGEGRKEEGEAKPASSTLFSPVWRPLELILPFLPSSFNSLTPPTFSNEINRS